MYVDGFFTLFTLKNIGKPGKKVSTDRFEKWHDLPQEIHTTLLFNFHPFSLKNIKVSSLAMCITLQRNISKQFVNKTYFF